MIFIERIIYRELRAGLDRLIAKPDIYEGFLLDGLDAEDLSGAEAEDARDEAARARQVFEANPPEVIHGYARVDGVFPCYAIVLGSESTDADFLGEEAMDSYLADYEDDDSRRVYLDGDGDRVDYHVRRWGHNFDVYTYADHPDLCLYYYYLCKQILAEARSDFLTADLDEIVYTGAELAPDTRYLPSGMFVRRLGVKLASDQVYRELVRPGIGAAARVSGIHVAEDDSDATGVAALVTPYVE